MNLATREDIAPFIMQAAMRTVRACPSGILVGNILLRFQYTGNTRSTAERACRIIQDAMVKAALDYMLPWTADE